MEIGKRIKKLRQEKDIKQKDFAEIIGLAQGALSSIESGNTKPSLDTIVAVCKEFNVSPNWLITGNEHIERPDEEKMGFKEFKSRTEKLIEESNLSEEEVEEILIKALELGKLMSKKD